MRQAGYKAYALSSCSYLLKRRGSSFPAVSVLFIRSESRATCRNGYDSSIVVPP